jgi:hypothetical protein
MNLIGDNGELLGFRPEHFCPAGDPLLSGSGGGAATFPFRIHREEYLGSEHLFYGEIGETKAVARFPVTQMIEAVPGQTYEFGVARQHIKRFDPATGLRIRDQS